MIWLRSAAFALYFFLGTPLLLVAATAVRLWAPHRSLATARLWARLTLAGARVLCGISYRVEGALPLPDGPALIASRHESAFDTFVWLLLLPRCAYVVKSELIGIPLLGRMMLAAGMIPVNRRAGAAGLRALAAGVRAALAAGRQVVIFPEGTRVAPTAPVDPQPGIALLAAQAGVPVLPVATDSGRYWPRRRLLKRPGTVRIVLRPTLPPARSRQDVLARLRCDMALGPVDKSVGG